MNVNGRMTDKTPNLILSLAILYLFTIHCYSLVSPPQSAMVEVKSFTQNFFLNYLGL